MPISLLRADNNLPPWRPGLSEVTLLVPSVLIIKIFDFAGQNFYNRLSILLSMIL